MNFLNFKISTLAGIIVLLLISFAVGSAIYYQMNQLMAVRVDIINNLPL